MSILQDVYSDLTLCSRCRCGFCRIGCAANSILGIESLTARGRNAVALSLLDGRLEHDVFTERIRRVHNPYGEPHEERMKWLPPKVRVAKKADIAYFVGCTTAYRRPEIAEATVRILNAAGVDFIALHPEEWCCGSPALRVGRRDLFLELARHNVEAIRRDVPRSLPLR